jgi:hypothetical protein
MTVKASEIKARSRRLTKGGWVSGLPSLPEVAVKVRSIRNPDASRMYAEAKASVSEEEFKDPEFQKDLNLSIITETVILDWRGIADDSAEADADGEYPELPYEPEIAKEMLADEENDLLFAGILWAAENVAERGQDSLEKAAKN